MAECVNFTFFTGLFSDKVSYFIQWQYLCRPGEKFSIMAEDKELDEQSTQEVKDEVTQEQTDENVQTEEKKELTPEEKYADLNDRFIRLYAEFDNFRKRTNKERIDLINSASAGVMKDMLTIIDDFERAIQNNENVEDIQAVKEGFQLIYQKFKGILESKGLKAMNSKGEAFDSELHEAIANIPAPTEDDKGKVVDDVEKGYYLNDKVIRFAKVVVGQ
jgi:molecular chaperone GrpE